MPSKLVILDRDGVINFDSAQFIKSPDGSRFPAAWKQSPGSSRTVTALSWRPTSPASAAACSTWIR